MKIITLYGYTKLNLGDDLMIEILLKRYPQFLFFYYGTEPESNIFLKYSNFININKFYNKYGRLNHILNILTFYKKEDFFYNWLLKRIKKRTVCSVYIGGSLYKENPNTNLDKLIEYEENKLSTGPLFIIGANFGPYTSSEFYNQYHGYFQQCAGLSFRDVYSTELFNDIEHTQYAPDVVFNLKNFDIQKKNHVVISVIDFYQKEKIKEFAEIYDKIIIKACHDAISHNLTPILQSCCEFEGDESAIQRIMEQLEPEIKEKTKSYFYNGDTEECLSLYSSAKYIIATRFHSMILAIKFNTPFYCLAYDNKIINLMNDLKSNLYCAPENFEKVQNDDIISKCQQIAESSDIILKSEQQFSQLDNFLNI